MSSLVEIEGGRAWEIEPEVVESLMAARKTGKYVVAVFRHEPAGDGLWTTHCVQHPHDFPGDKFGECVNLLKQAFDKVIGPPIKEAMERGRPMPKVTLWQPGRPAPSPGDQGVCDDVER